MKLPPIKKYNERDLVIISQNTIGTFSKVYRCKYGNDSVVCVKKITDTNKARILNEIWNLWKCRECPNVVQILGYIKPNVIVLENAGENLFEYLSNENIGLNDRRKIAEQCVEAVKQVNSCGVLHLDVKLDNFVIKNGVVKIIDFGLSQSVNYIKPVRSGTLGYMSPDMLKVPPVITSKCDLWSVGVVLYELFALHSPFDNGSSTRDEIVGRIVNMDIDINQMECVEYREVVRELMGVVN
jgi:serine/threonine protein kinase